MNRDQDFYTEMLNRARRNCDTAVCTLRRAVEDAERAVNDTTSSPERVIERVLHHASWGWANASSSLASAVSALEDARKIAAELVKEAP